MDLNYEQLKQEILDVLGVNKYWVLATSADNRVTARSMSIVNDGLNVYFQTETLLDKYKQILINPNIALCYHNVQIEGKAESKGQVASRENEKIRRIYCVHHNKSYERWQGVEEQVFIKVQPVKITMWKYVDSKPCRDFLYIDERRAVREYYHGEQYDN